MHGKFYRGHARYACRRTPRQTSGLPAGAEPSFESKAIIASTNPECPDTFEYNRATQLHGYGVTALQSYTSTHREEYGDHFAVQTVGAITPGEPTLKSVCRTSDHTFQLEQSNERDPECKKVCQKLLAPEKSHPLKSKSLSSGQYAKASWKLVQTLETLGTLADRSEEQRRNRP